MTKLVLVVSFLCVASVAAGNVWITIYEANGQTPFDGRKIMAGTKLTIIVSSDANGYWYGDLAIEGEGRDCGLLSARDYNEVTHDWEGSRFEAAGDMARVWDWEETGIDGFSLSGTVDGSAVAGDWFIIDYTATGPGECKVQFYDNFVPVDTYEFLQVRTRDFNGDTIVDFGDLTVYALYCQVTDCNDPNWCAGVDLDTSGNVDFGDFALFADYWLEMTEYSTRLRDFSRNHIVDFTDFALLASYWQAADCRDQAWCDETDLDTDRNVGFHDLILFTDYWLKRTE